MVNILPLSLSSLFRPLYILNSDVQTLGPSFLPKLELIRILKPSIISHRNFSTSSNLLTLECYNFLLSGSSNRRNFYTSMLSWNLYHERRHRQAWRATCYYEDLGHGRPSHRQNQLYQKVGQLLIIPLEKNFQYIPSILRTAVGTSKYIFWLSLIHI